MAGNSGLAWIDYINTKIWRRLSVTRLVESIIDRISLNFILKVGKNWLYLMGLTLLFVLPNSTLFSLEGFEIYIKSKETIEKFTWFVYFCMFGWLVVSLQVLILTFQCYYLDLDLKLTWVSAVKQQISLSLIQSGTKTKRTQIIRAYSSAYDFEVERWRKKMKVFF